MIGPGARRWIGRASPRLVLGLVALGLMLATPRFFSAANLGTILALASIVGVLAIGQAFVLIGGGFDLSQGAAAALRLPSGPGWRELGNITPGWPGRWCWPSGRRWGQSTGHSSPGSGPTRS